MKDFALSCLMFAAILVCLDRLIAVFDPSIKLLEGLVTLIAALAGAI